MVATGLGRGFLLVMAFVLACVAQGCAEERDPIDRTQPNALSKSLFVRSDADGNYLSDSDVWYFRATITDVPASQQTAFIGAAGDMNRVKWRIEEQFLVAYREDPDILESGDKSGGTIAAFPIVSHFDVRRTYNAQTGEEANVLEENTTDRPWQKRNFMRVDWSTNKVSEAAFTAPGFESISPANFYVQDPKSADHPIFQDGYVDITARYTVSPDPATCYYYYRDYGCTPGDVTARLSFMKAPVRDYVPRDFPDRQVINDDAGNPIRRINGDAVSLPVMDQFGFFRTERAVYDQRYGTLEKKYLYRANQWNLWSEWFQRDEQGKTKTSADGKPVLLPYRARKVRPIVYFVNPEFPEELRSVAQETADAWNDAFSETVASLRLLEDRAADPDKKVSFAEMRAEVDKMKAAGERLFVLCANNPVKEGDPAACGKAGDEARQGDLRYSFMYFVPKPQPSGPLGYGPSYADSISGEVMSASAYIYGGSLDTYSQWATDVVNLLNGKYQAYDYINGIATDLYAKRLKAGEAMGPQGTARVSLAASPGERGFNLAAAQTMVDRSVDRPLLAAITNKGLPIAQGPSGRDRLAMIRGTPFERKLLDNPELRVLAGKTPNDKLSDDDVKKMGDIVFDQDVGKKEGARLSFLAKHGCYYSAEFADDAVIGLAREMAKKYPGSPDAKEDEKQQLALWQELRKAIIRGVLEHEVGHTMGLRHNFEGSSDALNYFDEFWALKKETPDYGAALTEKQATGRMREFQYSTVMDYGSRFNSDVHSLGKYDYAAIRFGYGDLVESWPAGKVTDKLYGARPDAFSSAAFNEFNGYSAEILSSIHRDFRHYTQMPKEFADGTASMNRSGREVRAFADVAESARKRYVAAGTRPDTVKFTSANGGIDVVPYWYCGDEFAGTANRPLCDRWDQGADSFEVVQDAIGRYKDYYVFDAFARGRVGYNWVNGYLSRIISRYFSHVHAQYIHWLFYQGGQSYVWQQVLNGDGKGKSKGYITETDWLKDPAGGLPSTLATTWGLDRLVDVLGEPDVGVYAADDAGAFSQVASSPFACATRTGNFTRCESNENQLTLDIDLGARYRYTRYDSASGQGFFNRIVNAGAFYDKMAALLTLTSSDTNFLGQDQTNALSYRIGFYLAYPKAMASLFGGLVTDDLDRYAWRYSYDTSKRAVNLMSASPFQATGGSDSQADPPKDLKGAPLDSGWYFFYKAYALWFSMAEFQANFSQSWNDSVRVWCVGCGEAFTPGPGTVTELTTDPLSGKQYAAIRYGDGRYSPGAEMIKHANALVTAYKTAVAAPPDAQNRQYQIDVAQSRLSDAFEMLDLIRGMYDVYGYSRF